MKNLTPELVAKARAAKSAEELLELAKANSIEITDEEAKLYFEQLHANGAISDDELEAVAGGGICEAFEDFFELISGRNDSSSSGCDDKLNQLKAPKNPMFESTITPFTYNSFSYDTDDKIEHL